MENVFGNRLNGLLAHIGQQFQLGHGLVAQLRMHRRPLNTHGSGHFLAHPLMKANKYVANPPARRLAVATEEG